MSFFLGSILPLNSLVVTVHGYGIAVNTNNSCDKRRFMFFAVGMNNHRQFVLFVTTLVIGIILFDYLTYACEFLCPP